MQNVLQKMQVSMELKGFAKSTIKTYLGHIKRFAVFCDKPLNSEVAHLKISNIDINNKRIFVCQSKRFFIPVKILSNEIHHIIQYLGNYIHKIAIYNNRLISMDENSVALRWKDYAIST